MCRGRLLSKEMLQGWCSNSRFPFVCLNLFKDCTTCHLHVHAYACFHRPYHSLVPFSGAQEWAAPFSLPCPILSAQPPITLQALHKIYRDPENWAGEETVLCWSLKVIWYVSVEYRTLHTNRKMKISGEHCISAALDAMEHEVGLSTDVFTVPRDFPS